MIFKIKIKIPYDQETGTRSTRRPYHLPPCRNRKLLLVNFRT